MGLLWGFITGFLVGLFPLMLLYRIFKERNFIGIAHPYLKGAFMGFLVWITAGLIMYLDLRFSFIGFMHAETGGALIPLYTNSHFGFITSGIAIAYFNDTLDILKKKGEKKS